MEQGKARSSLVDAAPSAAVGRAFTILAAAVTYLCFGSVLAGLSHAIIEGNLALIPVLWLAAALAAGALWALRCGAGGRQTV